MKILIIKTAPGEIKIEKSTYNHQEIGLAKAFRRQGHVCDILCCSEGKSKVIPIETGNGKPILLYCKRAAVILKNGIYHIQDSLFAQYDILQLSEYNQVYTWHIAKKYSEKMVVYHGPYYCDFNKRYNLMAKVFDFFFVDRYKKLGTCFITKSRLASSYLESKGIHNVHTVGVGIDIEALTDGNREEIPFVENILKKQDFEYLLLYIGKIEPRRNPLFLLKILKEMKKRGFHAGLLLIGGGEEKYVSHFFEQAGQMQIRDRILYQERLEQKYLCQVYPFADVFLLPTIYDIFGMVLLEAMYFSLPVLTTLNGGADMLIEDGVNGFVFDTFEEQRWCDRLCAVLENRLLKEKIGKQAHAAICTWYTWDRLSIQFLRVYEEKMAEKGKCYDLL